MVLLSRAGRRGRDMRREMLDFLTHFFFHFVLKRIFFHVYAIVRAYGGRLFFFSPFCKLHMTISLKTKENTK